MVTRSSRSAGLMHPVGSRARAAPLALILNPSAGSEPGEDLGARFEALLGPSARVLLARGGNDVERLARSEVEAGTELLVAGGGDGTVSAVASVLAGTERILGVLPLGTLNHFARDLGIPLEPEAAARVLAEGYVREVDVGEVNGRIFLNNSSLGLYPLLVREREAHQEAHGLGKLLAFVASALRVLPRFRSLDLRVTAEGWDMFRRTPLLFVGNNAYEVEGLRIGARNRLDGGRLSVHLSRARAPIALLGIAVRALAGRLRPGRDVESLEVCEARVDTARRLITVARDGEVEDLAPPLVYRIRPRALRVLVPRPTGDR